VSLGAYTFGAYTFGAYPFGAQAGRQYPNLPVEEDL